MTCARIIGALGLVLLVPGCAADGDASAGDTSASLMAPPGDTRETCEAAGWTWLTDSFGVYCGGGRDCQYVTWSRCVWPCESDADCEGLTAPYCERIWVGESGDSLHCSPFAMCSTVPTPRNQWPRHGEPGCDL